MRDRCTQQDLTKTVTILDTVNFFCEFAEDTYLCVKIQQLYTSNYL